MSKESRKKELLSELVELQYELQNALDAVKEIVDNVENSTGNEEMLDAVSGSDWEDLLENAAYIEGSISLLKDICIVLDSETVK